MSGLRVPEPSNCIRDAQVSSFGDADVQVSAVSELIEEIEAEEVRLVDNLRDANTTRLEVTVDGITLVAQRLDTEDQKVVNAENALDFGDSCFGVRRILFWVGPIRVQFVRFIVPFFLPIWPGLCVVKYRFLACGDHPRMHVQMKVFHVGSHPFRESFRELLREFWFSHCTSRETPFREWDFAFRELFSELRDSEIGLFAPRAFFLKLGWSPGFWRFVSKLCYFEISPQNDVKVASRKTFRREKNQ